MSFDSVVTNPGRLRILTALAVEERQEFVQLRHATQLTDGNLSAHARRLHSAGLVDIDKQFRAGRPVTSFVLTSAGRVALESHTRRLLAAISHRRVVGTASGNSTSGAPVSASYRPPTPSNAPNAKAKQPQVMDPVEVSDVSDDWVD